MPASSRPRDVSRAIAHIRANLHRTVPIAELAARAGVSERTPHEHFRTFIGAAPGSFSLRIRLAAVRRELQEPSRRDSITDIALRYGLIAP
jgi:transcriptional regulator GlxA family with amidase domain